MHNQDTSNQSQHSPVENTGALKHLKVLDLSRILAGPWASQVLADMGATVIKVENPDGGDDTRRWGPPFIQNADGTNGDAAYFTAANRNKQSVTINFSTSEGADLVRQLAADCDIVIENYKLGGLAKYGLDYAALTKINPAIIYCSITGFGQSGPYSHRAGYDFLIQGMGGLMSITGQPDGAPGSEPVKVGVAVTDLFTGMYAAVSILTALHHRDRTGEGQYIECSLLDSQVAMLANQASNWLVGSFKPQRMGNHHPSIVPYGVYPTREGHVIITCGNDTQYQRLCTAMGATELAENPAYLTNADRVEHREQLNHLLSAVTCTYTRTDLIALLEKVNVPCGPINDVQDVFADPHVQDRGLEVTTTDELGNSLSTVAFPARLSATPASYRQGPPSLGADTRRVLKTRLNMTDKLIDSLDEQGIIG